MRNADGPRSKKSKSTIRVNLANRSKPDQVQQTAEISYKVLQLQKKQMDSSDIRKLRRKGSIRVVSEKSESETEQILGDKR